MKFQSIGKAALPFAMVAGLGLGQAQAADLGGDCCADLEERIAELEATTVRKGNRRVSLKLSGQVNTGVLYWDDGLDNDIYVIDNTSSSSRFRVTGSAQIVSGWKAGFIIELEVTAGATGLNVTQVDDDGGQNGDARPDLRRASWYMQSDHLGRVTVGQGSLATDDIALISVGGNGVISNDTTLWGRMLITRGNTHAAAGDTNVGGVIQSFDTTSRSNVVRYDSPAIMGFTLSSAWGEDDAWDVALRYANEFGGIRVAGGAGYFESSDDTTGLVNGTAPSTTDSRFLGSVSAIHVDSGLFATVFWNVGDDDEIADQDTQAWGLRAGWYNKVLPLGKTSVYIGYQEHENDNAVFTIAGMGVAANANNVAAGNVEGTVYEVGLVQHIDAAAMELYLAYKHYDLDIPGINDENDQDYVFAGGRIKF